MTSMKLPVFVTRVGTAVTKALGDAAKKNSQQLIDNSAKTLLPPTHLLKNRSYFHGLNLSGLQVFSGLGTRIRIPPQSPPTGPRLPLGSHTKFTMAGLDTGNLTMSELDRVFELPQFQKLLHEADYLGVHGTTDRNMKGIVASGIDLSRTGANFGGFSLLGDGHYFSDDPANAVRYAIRAAMRDYPTGNAEPQVMLIFKPRSSEQVNTYARTAGEKLNEIDEANVHLVQVNEQDSKITRAGINSEKVEFVGVALPAFPLSEGGYATTHLENFVKKIDEFYKNRSEALD